MEMNGVFEAVFGGTRLGCTDVGGTSSDANGNLMANGIMANVFVPADGAVQATLQVIQVA